MVVIIDKSLPPICPLCLERFQKYYSPKFLGKEVFYVCLKDEISINKRDPYVDKWHDYKTSGEDISPECFNCGTLMRWFGRSDGFMKTVCPKCHASIATGKEEDLPKIKRGPQVSK